MSSNQFLVIGIGRFGKSVVKGLYDSDCHVVAIDTKEEFLQDISEYADITVVADATEDAVLDDLDVQNFESIILSIGDSFESAILIAKKLRDRKCKHIVAKANDKLRGEVLEAIGVNQVVYPLEEAGLRVGRALSSTDIIDYFDINDTVGAMELKVPLKFLNKSLSELDFTSRFGLTVALILRNGKPLLEHFAYEKFIEGDCFLIIGDKNKLEKFKGKYYK